MFAVFVARSHSTYAHRRKSHRKRSNVIVIRTSVRKVVWFFSRSVVTAVFSSIFYSEHFQLRPQTQKKWIHKQTPSEVVSWNDRVRSAKGREGRIWLHPLPCVVAHLGTGRSSHPSQGLNRILMQISSEGIFSLSENLRSLLMPS